MSLLQVLKLSLPKGAEGKTAVPAQKAQKLSQAADAWRQTHAQADARIGTLKQTIQAHCAGAHPALLDEIDKGLGKLDGVLDAVDHRLADAMANAGTAADDDTHKAGLKSAKALLADYINYVKSEPLIAHMDQNPFGVKTDLKGLLVGGLTQAAKAIG